MAVDRNAMIKLHKSLQSNDEIAKRLDMPRSTVWKTVKKIQETGNTLDLLGCGRKLSVRYPQLFKNTREKMRRNLRRSCRTLAAAAGVIKSTRHQVLRDDLGVKPFKMLHCQELRPIMWPWGSKNAGKSSRKWPTARCRPSCSRTTKKFRHPTGGKPAKWPSLDFLVIHRGKDRHQTPESAVCHSLGGRHRTGRSALLFVPSRELNSQRYIAEILEGCLLPWAKKHFQWVSWFLQQDSAPSHIFKITQSWVQKKIPSFISKEV